MSYAHRSLQEFFAAWFIAEAPSSHQITLLDRYLSNVTDQVIPLVDEMRPGLAGRALVLRILDNLFVDDEGGATDLAWFLTRLNARLHVGRMALRPNGQRTREWRFQVGTEGSRLLNVLELSPALSEVGDLCRNIFSHDWAMVDIDIERVADWELQDDETKDLGSIWSHDESGLKLFRPEAIIGLVGLAAFRKLRHDLRQRYASGDAKLRDLLRLT